MLLHFHCRAVLCGGADVQAASADGAPNGNAFPRSSAPTLMETQMGLQGKKAPLTEAGLVFAKFKPR